MMVSLAIHQHNWNTGRFASWDYSRVMLIWKEEDIGALTWDYNFGRTWLAGRGQSLFAPMALYKEGDLQSMTHMLQSPSSMNSSWIDSSVAWLHDWICRRTETSIMATQVTMSWNNKYPFKHAWKCAWLDQLNPHMHGHVRGFNIHPRPDQNWCSSHETTWSRRYDTVLNEIMSWQVPHCTLSLSISTKSDEATLHIMPFLFCQSLNTDNDRLSVAVFKLQEVQVRAWSLTCVSRIRHLLS